MEPTVSVCKSGVVTKNMIRNSGCKHWGMCRRAQLYIMRTALENTLEYLKMNTINFNLPAGDIFLLFLAKETRLN